MTWRTFAKSRGTAASAEQAQGSARRLATIAGDEGAISLDRNFEPDRYVSVRLRSRTEAYPLDQPGTLPFTRLASGFHMINGSSVEAPAPSVLLVLGAGHNVGQFAAADVLCKAM